jgi:hypothetical protein
MTYFSGRWSVLLDTSALTGACHTVTASIDDLAAGSFELTLRTPDLAKTAAARTR